MADGDTFTIVIVYATVCTGVRFMRYFAEFERRTTMSTVRLTKSSVVLYISEGTN
jgi:hypothetical protein